MSLAFVLVVTAQLPASGMSLNSSYCPRRAIRILPGLLLCVCATLPPPSASAATSGYRQPPKDVVAVISAPRPPLIAVAPDQRLAVLAEPEEFSRLDDLAQPMASVAGRRLDLGSHARRGIMRYSGLALLDLSGGEIRPLRLAGDARVGFPQWSPRGDRIAFAVFTRSGVELWHADSKDGEPAKLAGIRLNAAAGRSFAWMPDGRTILCRLVPGSASAMPALPSSIPGPVVREASGSRQPPGTDHIQHDSRELALFDYFMRSQLAFADTATGEITPIGAPDLYDEFMPSPDGRFVVVTRLAPLGGASVDPVSAGNAFEVWSVGGKILSSFSSPTESASGELRKRRGFRWQHTASATFQWIEDVFPSDGLRAPVSGQRVMLSPAPFKAAPREIFRSEHHITGIDWVDATVFAIVHVYDDEERRASAWLVDSQAPDAKPSRLWTRHIDDRYGDPGRPMTKRNGAGMDVVIHDRGHIFMSSRGITALGERPFVSRWSLAEKRGQVIWRSAEGSYTAPVALLDTNDRELLIRHEASAVPPNYAIVAMGDGVRRELTHFRSPDAEAFRVRKQIVTFRRAD